MLFWVRFIMAGVLVILTFIMAVQLGQLTVFTLLER